MSFNLGNDLQTFDHTLGEVLKGQRKGIVQLKDIAYFKRIRNKIESYPLLKEIYQVKRSVNRRPYRIKQNAYKAESAKQISLVKRSYTPTETIGENLDESGSTYTRKIEHYIETSILGVKGMFEMLRKLKIATINSMSSDLKIPALFTQSLFFILFGSIDSFIIYKKKLGGAADPYSLIDSKTMSSPISINELNLNPSENTRKVEIKESCDMFQDQKITFYDISSSKFEAYIGLSVKQQNEFQKMMFFEVYKSGSHILPLFETLGAKIVSFFENFNHQSNK